MASVLKDRSKLSFDYVPDRLVHRERQMKAILDIFKPILESNVSARALLLGGVGTGKTALSKRFSIDFKKMAEGKLGIEFALVNCRLTSTNNGALLKIVQRFDPNFPDRGFSITEMLQILRKHLEKRKVHLVSILDEADVLIKRSGCDLIYSFTRFDEESLVQRSSMSLILISQRNILDLMDAATLSTFKRTGIIEFSRYNAEELRDILRSRAELSFHDGAIEEQCIELIADIASEYGDARYGIELLETAGLLADEKGSTTVEPENIRSAKAQIKSYFTEERLSQLDKSHKLVLLAIARSIRNKSFVSTGEVEDVYKVVCEETDEKAKGHTQFWTYLKDLDAYGLIDTKKSGRGMPGKTTLISLSDFPAGELINILEHELS
jgi:cell division control protein 6